MLLSVVVFTVTAFVLFLLGQKAATYSCGNSQDVLQPENNLYHTWAIYGYIFVIAAFCGLRFNTGLDYMDYMLDFQFLKKYGTLRRGDYEPGFMAINYSLAWIKCHYAIYFMLWGLVQACLFVFALRKRNFLLPWFGLFLFLGPFYLNWLSFLRQWTISFVLMALIPLLLRKKYLIYCLIVLICCTLHKSAFILLLLPLLPFSRIANASKWVYVGAFLAAILIGAFPVWTHIFKYLSSLVQLIGYEKYGELLDSIANGGATFHAFGPRHIITIFVELLMIATYIWIRPAFKNDRLLPYYFTLAILCVCYENLVTNTSYILLRVCDYFYPFVYIILGYGAHRLWKEKHYTILCSALVLVCCYSYINFFKSAYDPGPLSKRMLFHFLPLFQ